MKVIFNHNMIVRQQEEEKTTHPVGYLYENLDDFPNLVVNQLWNHQDKGLLINNNQPLEEVINEEDYHKVISTLDEWVIYGQSDEEVRL